MLLVFLGPPILAGLWLFVQLIAVRPIVGAMTLLPAVVGGALLVALILKCCEPNKRMTRSERIPLPPSVSEWLGEPGAENPFLPGAWAVEHSERRQLAALAERKDEIKAGQFSLLFLFDQMLCIAVGLAFLRWLLGDWPAENELPRVAAIVGMYVAACASVGGFLGSIRLGSLFGLLTWPFFLLLMTALTAVRE